MTATLPHYRKNNPGKVIIIDSVQINKYKQEKIKLKKCQVLKRISKVGLSVDIENKK